MSCFELNAPSRSINLAEAIRELEQQQEFNESEDVVDQWFTEVHEDHFYDHTSTRKRKSAKSSSNNRTVISLSQGGRSRSQQRNKSNKTVESPLQTILNSQKLAASRRKRVAETYDNDSKRKKVKLVKAADSMDCQMDELDRMLREHNKKFALASGTSKCGLENKPSDSLSNVKVKKKPLVSSRRTVVSTTTSKAKASLVKSQQTIKRFLNDSKDASDALIKKAMNKNQELSCRDIGKTLSSKINTCIKTQDLQKPSVLKKSSSTKDPNLLITSKKTATKMLSVKDVRRWEEKSGEKYFGLSPASRQWADKEIRELISHD